MPAISLDTLSSIPILFVSLLLEAASFWRIAIVLHHTLIAHRNP